MRILNLVGAASHMIGQYGSREATVQPIGNFNAEGHAVIIRIAPGGVLGLHEAASQQLFIILAGEGWVSAGDSDPVSIRTGQAVLWDAGEQHETRSVEGLTALVLEGNVLSLALENEGGPAS